MSKNVAVIGSGFGGLSVAIRLQAQGYRVKLFEKRDKPGGRAYVYKEQGFTFDAGPTVVTAPQCIEELFDLSGKNMDDYLKLVPVMPFYRLLWDDGKQFDYSNDMEKTLKQIAEFNPQDVQGYKDFLEYSEKVFNAGYTDLAHVPFLKWWDMIKVSPQLIKLKAFNSVYHQVSKFIKDDHLRQAFSFNSLLVGGNPFQTSSIYTLITHLEKKWGVYFPLGGTGALVQGLVRLFEDLGGELVLNAEIDEVLTNWKGVTGVQLKNGEKYSCDKVISNGDVYLTYANLLKNDARANFPRRRLKRGKFSMSLFLIYFGTRKKYENLAHHSVLFGPRYKALLEDIFKNGKLPDDFSLYLHSPGRTDPSLAPEGKDSFYVLSPVGHLGNLKVNWKDKQDEYADRILSYLEKRCMPDLKSNIEVMKYFTPKDFETELNSYQGSAFSLEPVLYQSAFFRVHNRDSKIKGLYFVGAGTHPGAGIPGVINSGKATAGVLMQDDGRANA